MCNLIPIYVYSAHCVLGEIYPFEKTLLYRLQPIAKEGMTQSFPEIDPTDHWADGWGNLGGISNLG